MTTTATKRMRARFLLSRTKSAIEGKTTARNMVAVEMSRVSSLMGPVPPAGTRHRPDFDLSGATAHRQVGQPLVLGLAGPCGDHGAVAARPRQPQRLQGPS